MAYKKLIKPSSKGLTVRDPISKDILPETGDYKPIDKYWKRRIMDGSVILVEEKPIQFGTKMKDTKYENKGLKFKKENEK